VAEDLARADLRAAAIALIERTTAASGVPIVVSDPAALDRLAALIVPQETPRRHERRRVAKRAGRAFEEPQPADRGGTRDAVPAV